MGKTYDINGMLNLLSAGMFQSYFSRESLNLAQYGAMTALLIQNGISFDTKFTPTTGRNASELIVTVYITPKITIDFSFSQLELADSS